VRPAIALPHARRQNVCVSAEQIIALEAALADLSDLYAVTRNFTALQSGAEAELLPRIYAIGARLRSLVRAGNLDDAAIDRNATEILACATQWRGALGEIRGSPLYQRAVHDVASARQATLAEVIPQVFARVRVVQPAPSLYFPVSPSGGRRRPGSSPFLSPADCADKIMQLLADGIEPDVETAEWWERELPSIVCADTPAGVESPIVLCVAAAAVPVTVFADIDAATLRVFTPRLRAPMSVLLARDATDEWWEAYQDSYHVFRVALQQHLAARGEIAGAAES